MKRSSPVALACVLLLGVMPLVVTPDLSFVTWTFEFSDEVGFVPLWSLSGALRLAWFVPFVAYLLALASAASGVLTGRENPGATAWLLAISLPFPAWVYAINTQSIPVGVAGTGAVIVGFYWPGVVPGRATGSRSSEPTERGDAATDDAESADGDDEGTTLAESPAPEAVEKPADPGGITPRATSDAVKKAREEGSFREAELSYEATLVDFRAAVDEFDDRGEPERRESAEKRLRQGVARRDAVRVLRRERAELRETLVAAEENYRVATVAYSDDRTTLSKLRFRQARDGFDDALAALDETEGLLAVPIDAEVDPDGSFRSTALDGLLELSDPAVDALADAGIETVEGACEAAPGPDEAEALSDVAPVADLLADGEMEDETATRLDGFSAYCDPLTVADREDIERRRDQAADRYEASI